MSEEHSLVSAGRLAIAIGIAAAISLAAVLAAMVSPFWIEDGGQPSRLGAVSLTDGEPAQVGPLTRAAEFYGSLSRLDSDPHHLQAAAEAYFQVGEMLESSEPDRALESYRNCVDYLEEYNHGWPWFKMGMIELDRRRYDSAEEYLKKSMQIDDGALALRAGYERGKIALRTGQPDRAWDYFYEFLRFYPRPILTTQFQTMYGNGATPVGRGFYVVGRCLLELGRSKDARAHLREYIDRFPNDISGRFYAGKTGLKMDMPDPEEIDFLESEPRISAGVRERGNVLVFETTGRVMMDVYVPKGGRSYYLTLFATKPILELDLILNVLANAEQVGQIDPIARPDVESRLSSSSLTMPIQLHAGHNVLEIALPYVPRREEPPDSYVHIHSISLSAEGST